MRTFTLFLLTAAVAAGFPLLDSSVGPLRLEKAPLPAVLRALARASGTNLAVDPGVAGEVTATLSRGPLHSVLAALTAPGGYSFEETPDGVLIRHRLTVLYPIDYPQLTRSGSGSASITLGGVNSGNSTGQFPFGQQQQQAGMLGGVMDATQVSISQENQNTFWSTLEAELKAMLGEGDRLILNKFSGVAQISAPVPRHEDIRAFLDLVTTRITRQVEIEARLVEVALRDEQKLGVNWELARASLGGGWEAEARAPLRVAGIGGMLFGADTFSANIGRSHASAVIQALSEQGEVRTVAQPRLRALNNQTAFVKVGEDRPFFRLQQSTSFSQPGTTGPFNQTQESFSVSTITIGTILAVTPQIGGDGAITLDVLPAITRLQAIVTSPDGRQTAPVTEVKQASTIVKLRDGETAVIGGLISEEEGEGVRAVPVLGRVPVLGAAFRSRGKLRTRTELIIFLTPRLVAR